MMVTTTAAARMSCMVMGMLGRRRAHRLAGRAPAAATAMHMHTSSPTRSRSPGHPTLAQEQGKGSSSSSSTDSGRGEQHGDGPTTTVLSYGERKSLYNRWYMVAEEFLFDSSERRLMSLANASNILGQCIKLFPKRPRGYALRAKCFLFKGEMGRAKRDLDRAIHLRSADPEVYYHRGALHMLEGNMGEASQNYERCMMLLGEYSARIDAMRQEMAAASGSSSDNNGQKKQKQQQQQQERQEQEKEKGVGQEVDATLVHDMESARDVLLAKCLNNMAFLMMLMEKHRVHEAITMLDQSIALTEKQMNSGDDISSRISGLDDNDRQAYYNRARAYMELERYEEALRDFQHFLISSPFHFAGYLHLSRCLYELGHYQQALSVTNRAFTMVQKDPVADHDVQGQAIRKEQLHELYTLRGFCHMKVGAFMESIDDLSIVVEDNLQSHLPFANRGIALHAFRDYKRAICDWDDALLRYQDDPILYWLRAQSFEAVGQFDDAVADLSAVVLRAEENARKRSNAEQDGDVAEYLSLFENTINERGSTSLLGNNSSSTDLGTLDKEGLNLMNIVIDDVFDRRKRRMRQRGSGNTKSTLSSRPPPTVDHAEENIILAAFDTKIALITLKHLEQKRRQLMESTDPETRKQLQLDMDQTLKKTLAHLSLAIQRDPVCLFALHHRGQILAHRFAHVLKDQRQLAQMASQSGKDSSLSKQSRRGLEMLRLAFDEACVDMTAVIELTQSLLAESETPVEENKQTIASKRDSERRLRWERLRMLALHSRAVLNFEMEFFAEAADDFGSVVEVIHRVGSKRLGISDAFRQSALRYQVKSNLRSGKLRALSNWARNKLLGKWSP